MSVKVTVITVCFNSEKTIEKTIHSVLNQGTPVFEYIIIDGKSTDRTLEIIAQYQPLFGEKMRVISEPDNGIYDAMNKGVALATGDFIHILNSDDYLEPDAIAHVSAAYDKSATHQIIYGLQRNVDDGKEIEIVYFNDAYWKTKGIYHQACFVSRSLHQAFGLYDVQYKCCADYDFMLKVLTQCGAALKLTPVYQVVVNFSVGGFSTTSYRNHDVAEIQLKYNAISKRKYVFLKGKAYVKQAREMLLGW